MYKKIKKLLIGNIGLGNQTNREEWLQKTLADIPATSKILDAGAGELKYKKFCTHLDYTSQDFGQYDGSGNNEGKQTGGWDNSKLDIVSDITKIPRPDNSFDAIMCIEVFEHLPEPILAVKEFTRLLKPGGTLIITAPFASLTHFAPYHFVSGYNKYWYEYVLKKYDFVLDEIVLNGNYFEYIAQEMRRLNDMEKNWSESRIGRSIVGKIAISLMLILLNHMSLKNKKSEEVLCFGVQILAHKK